MADTRELKIVINGDTRGLSDGLNKAEKGMSGFGASLKRIGEIAGGIGMEKLISGAFNAIKTFATESVKEFNESQLAIRQLDSVLASTSNVAGVTKKQVLDLANSLQRQTMFTDDAILSAQNLLLTFTNIKSNVFPQATETVLNMSQALGQDLKSSSIQLGKALQDPIVGVTALRRVGVMFTDDQESMIKKMAQAGDMMSAQKLILAELSTEFGGSARNAAQGFDFQLKLLNDTWRDFQKEVGKAITEVLTPLVAKLNEVIATLTVNGSVLEGLKNKYMEARNALQPFLNKLNELWTIISNFLKPAVEFFLSELEKLISNVRALNIDWGAFGKLLTTVGQVIGAVLLVAIRAVITILALMLRAINDNKVLIQALITTVGQLADGFNNVINTIKNVISWISKIPSKVGISISASTNKKATGGFASGLTLVGERGPEMVSLPAGSYVHNASSTKDMGGSGTTVNIYNPSVRNDNDIREIVRQIKFSLGRDNELARLGAY